MLFVAFAQISYPQDLFGVGGAPQKSPFFYMRKYDDTTNTSDTSATSATSDTNLLGNTLVRVHSDKISV